MPEPMTENQQWYIACLQRDLNWTAEQVAALATAQRITDPTTWRGAQRLIRALRAVRNGEYIELRMEGVQE